MILVDVGVWLAGTWGAHLHHPAVRTWFDSEERELLMCRVTQMSLLRLLSNPSVMRGDALTRDAAWDVVDQLRADERVRWMDEPIHLEPVWRALSARRDASHKLWTDDYLAAFAQSADVALATLDRALDERYPSVSVETLVAAS